MADQSYRPNTEENEYQYQEEQEGGGNFKYSEDHSPRKRKLNIKAIIILIVAVLIISVAFKVWSNRHHRAAEATNVDNLTAELAPKATSTQPSTTPTTAENAVANNLTPGSGQQSAPTADIQKLQTMQEQTQDSLSSLEKQQFQTQASIMTMQQSIDQMTQQLQSATQSLQVLNQDYQARLAKERQAIIAKQQAQAFLRKTKQYFVNAVIPGRAWLKGADGTMLTIVVGDTIPGYGKVLSIDPYSGQVVTEKGVLPYGQS